MKESFGFFDLKENLFLLTKSAFHEGVEQNDPREVCKELKRRNLLVTNEPGRYTYKKLIPQLKTRPRFYAVRVGSIGRGLAGAHGRKGQRDFALEYRYLRMNVSEMGAGLAGHRVPGCPGYQTPLGQPAHSRGNCLNRVYPQSRASLVNFHTAQHSVFGSVPGVHCRNTQRNTRDNTRRNTQKNTAIYLGSTRYG